MNLNRFPWLMLVVLSFHLGAVAVFAQQAPASGAELKFVVVFTRHGVRPPTWSAEELNQYSTEAWPKWDVPAGNLTSHGRTLIKLFGAYDRAYLAHAGLLKPEGCAEAGQVYIWTNNDERTIETGRALAAGMLPGCEVAAHALPEGTTDPLFLPTLAGVGNPDRALAAAAVSGRIGGNPRAVMDLYRPALETMQQVLVGCKPGPQCPPEGKSVKLLLLEQPVSLAPAKGDRLADLSPLNRASTLAENFLLEYLNGMEGKDLGWGRLNESNLRELGSLHTAYGDLLRRTPYVARTNASNLMSHILKSMEQAVAGKELPGALGKPGDRLLVIVGHDNNICNIAGMLGGLSWLIEGYQRDETPVGGRLVFELWRRPASGEYTVRTYYMCQTPEQMRKALPLTLSSPPAKSAIFLPGCSTAGEGLPCDWKAFQRIVDAAIDPAFVKQ